MTHATVILVVVWANLDLGSLGEIAIHGRVEMGRKKARMIILVGWLVNPSTGQIHEEGIIYNLYKPPPKLAASH